MNLVEIKSSVLIQERLQLEKQLDDLKRKVEIYETNAKALQSTVLNIGQRLSLEMGQIRKDLGTQLVDTRSLSRFEDEVAKVPAKLPSATSDMAHNLHRAAQTKTHQPYSETYQQELRSQQEMKGQSQYDLTSISIRSTGSVGG